MLITSTHTWLRYLESSNSIIRSMGLEARIREEPLNAFALNLANQIDHHQLISAGFDQLINYGILDIEKSIVLLKRLLSGTKHLSGSCGAFAELATYIIFAECDLLLTTEITLDAHAVLSKNGATIDGQLEGYLYFDVKIFSITGYLIEQLRQTLTTLIPNKRISISGTWDVSIMFLDDLLARPINLAETLRGVGHKVFANGMTITAEVAQSINIEMRSYDPYQLAESNYRHPFKYANQFTRHHPFILIFAMHPWINPALIGGGQERYEFLIPFMRSFSRRVFMQSRYMLDPVSLFCPKAASNILCDQAARLLSGILFVDILPRGINSEGSRRRHYLFINPNADFKITRYPLSKIGGSSTDVLVTDDFRYDNY